MILCNALSRSKLEYAPDAWNSTTLTDSSTLGTNLLISFSLTLQQVTGTCDAMNVSTLQPRWRFLDVYWSLSFRTNSVTHSFLKMLAYVYFSTSDVYGSTEAAASGAYRCIHTFNREFTSLTNTCNLLYQILRLYWKESRRLILLGTPCFLLCSCSFTFPLSCSFHFALPDCNWIYSCCQAL